MPKSVAQLPYPPFIMHFESMPMFVKFGNLRPDVSDDDLKSVDPAFRAWLKSVKSTGKSVASGALEEKDRGMTVLEADDRDEALKIFEQDPFNELLSSWHVHQWYVVD